MTYDIPTLPVRPRWLRNALIRFVVLAGVMFTIMAVGMLLWPGDDPVDWRLTLVNSLVFAAGLVAGRVVSERRYGREARYDGKHPHARAAMWTDVGVMTLVVGVAVVVLKLFFY